jgi:hypothetical protein
VELRLDDVKSTTARLVGSRTWASSKLYWMATKRYSIGELAPDMHAGAPVKDWEVTFRTATTVLIEFDSNEQVDDVQVVRRGRVTVVGVAPVLA